MMRVPTGLRVKAMLRRCAAAGAMALVVRHGDDDAGMLFVKVRLLDGTARLWGPAPAGLAPEDALPRLVPHLAPDGVAEAEADAYLARQLSFDADIWIVEIEDRLGRDLAND